MDTANFDLRLDEGWLFHYGELDMIDPDKRLAMSHETTKADGMLREYVMFKHPEAWTSVNVPHDWLTHQPLDIDADPACGYKKRETAWYYNSFELPEKRINSARLVFDGVLGKTTVFVNGVIAHRNFSGYNRFSCEIGDYLMPGAKNEIVLHVDARRWEGWWYEGAGLYRPVRIEFRGETAFDKEHSFVKSEKEDSDWYLTANVKAFGAACAKATLSDMYGVAVWNGEIPVNEDFRIAVPDPKLWSPENPNLYKFECILNGEEGCVDKISFMVGFRTVEWVCDEGMYLNGKQYQIKGICCHQDHAGVGAATTEEILRYRVSVLKGFGINAYRCAHHAPDERLLSICDEMGMLVMPENRHFNVSEDVLNQLDSMVLVSRNHPCVFMYSLFNEEPLQQEERGKRIAEKLKCRILSLDDTRAITGAQNTGLLCEANASDVLDVIGANYCLNDYEEGHKRMPQKVMLGTENCPTYATRGVYASDKEKKVFACYGDEWGDFSESLDETMENVADKPYVAGCFAWSGFDYRGEPVPYDWPSVMSHWGFTDECGFAKDTAYHLAAWYKEELMVHLLPHWNWKEGENVRVCAFTNGDTAELFVNGKSFGEKKVEKRRAEWNVPFEEGKATVVAKRGACVATDQVVTAAEPCRILIDDASTSQTLHILNLSVVDENDVLVPDFCDTIFFDVPEGVVLGVGNGNPNSHHREKASEIDFFNGRAQIIVSGKRGGALVARCKGLLDAEFEL